MNMLIKKLKSLPYTDTYTLNVRYWINYYGTRNIICLEQLRIKTKSLNNKEIWSMVHSLSNDIDYYPKIRALLKFLKEEPVCVNGKFLELDIAVYEDELNENYTGNKSN